MAMDISKLAERLSQLNTKVEYGEKSGIEFITIKDGRNVIRILPPANPDALLGTEVWVHYGVGKTEANKKGTMVVCPKTHGEDKACPVCELSSEIKKLSKKKDDNYDKQAKSCYRKKRVYYDALPREEDPTTYSQDEDGKWINADGDESKPVKVLATGLGVYKDLLGIICDPEYGDITDPEKGLDIIITKSGSGQFDTKYDVKTVRKESPIGFGKWEECLNDLTKLTEVKSYDDLLALLDGTPTATKENKPEAPKEDTTPKAPKEDSAPESTDNLQDEIMAALSRRKGK